MRIIVVSGSKSGVGKTYVAEQLLKKLAGWSALKVTVSKGAICPHNKNCRICPEIKEPFYIIKDKKTINQPGKDTARLKQAGARQVIWLKARLDGLKKGFSQAMQEFSSCPGIIIEGTSVLKFIRPDINIHVSGRGKYKLCY